MSEIYTVKSAPMWFILSPDRYIKKSIQDNSLAVFEYERDARKQVSKISEANSEICTIEEFALCSKDKLSKYTQIHNEMYEMLRKMYAVMSHLSNDPGLSTHKRECCGDDANSVDLLLAKARGENESHS